MKQHECNFKYKNSKLKKVEISGPNFLMYHDIISVCANCGRISVMKNVEIRTINCWGPFPFHYEETEDFWKKIDKNIIVKNALKKSEYEKIIKFLNVSISNLNNKQKISRIKSTYERYKHVQEFLIKEKVTKTNIRLINDEIKKEIKEIIKSIGINDEGIKKEFKSKNDFNKIKRLYNYLNLLIRK